MRYAVVCTMLALAACNGDTNVAKGTYTIGGVVTGLSDGTLLLSNNGADPLTVRQSGRFTFAATVKQGDRYDVRVVTAPSTLTCTVTGGSGGVAAASVTTVAIACVSKSATGFLVSGTLSGLEAGNGNVLLQQGSEQLSVSTNGSFKFVNRVASGAQYTVSVATAPKGYICGVARSSGIANSDVTDVAVTCTRPAYSVSGTVFGASGPVTVTSGSVDFVVDSGQTAFSFGGFRTDDLYEVAVSQAPMGQECSVEHGSGPVTNANVTNVVVKCTVKTYVVSGTVTNNTGSITITNNDSDDINLGPQDTAFSFKGLLDGAPYSIAITSLPPGENCTIQAGTPSGNIESKSVTDLVVNCYQVTQYHLTGVVNGATGDVTLKNTGDATDYVVHPNSNTFDILANEGSTYGISVKQAPTGQVCSVAGGSGTNLTGDVGNIVVSCSTLSVIGTVTGNTNTTVANPNGLILSVSKSGTATLVAVPAAATDVNFGFPGYVTGDTWSVDVYSSPWGLNCALGPGGPTPGTVANANITGVIVTCTPTQYPFLLTTTWNSSGGGCQTVTVNWASDSNSGSVAFPCTDYNASYLGVAEQIGPINDGETLTLSLAAQPSGRTCVFRPDSSYVIHGGAAGARLICDPPSYPRECN